MDAVGPCMRLSLHVSNVTCHKWTFFQHAPKSMDARRKTLNCTKATWNAFYTCGSLAAFLWNNTPLQRSGAGRIVCVFLAFQRAMYGFVPSCPKQLSWGCFQLTSNLRTNRSISHGSEYILLIIGIWSEEMWTKYLLYLGFALIISIGLTRYGSISTTLLERLSLTSVTSGSFGYDI